MLFIYATYIPLCKQSSRKTKGRTHIQTPEAEVKQFSEYFCTQKSNAQKAYRTVRQAKQNPSWSRQESKVQKNSQGPREQDKGIKILGEQNTRKRLQRLTQGKKTTWYREGGNTQTETTRGGELKWLLPCVNCSCSCEFDTWHSCSNERKLSTK